MKVFAFSLYSKYTFIYYMPLFFCMMLCKSLVSSVLQPPACITVHICCLTKFCNANSCNICRLFIFCSDVAKYSDREVGKEEIYWGKGASDPPTTSATGACTVSHMVILWLHPYRPPNQDDSWFSTYVCPSAPMGPAPCCPCLLCYPPLPSLYLLPY